MQLGSEAPSSCLAATCQLGEIYYFLVHVKLHFQGLRFSISIEKAKYTCRFVVVVLCKQMMASTLQLIFFFTFIGRFIFLAVLLLGIRRICLCWSFSLLFYKYTFSVGRMQSGTVAERDLMTIRTPCTFFKALLFGSLRFYRHTFQQLRCQGPHFKWQLQSFIRYGVGGTTVICSNCITVQNFSLLQEVYMGDRWLCIHAFLCTSLCKTRI